MNYKGVLNFFKDKTTVGPFRQYHTDYVVYFQRVFHNVSSSSLKTTRPTQYITVFDSSSSLPVVNRQTNQIQSTPEESIVETEEYSTSNLRSVSYFFENLLLKQTRNRVVVDSIYFLRFITNYVGKHSFHRFHVFVVIDWLAFEILRRAGAEQTVKVCFHDAFTLYKRRNFHVP